MKVVAFDAKRFQRIRRGWNEDETKEEKTRVFLSQLGAGVTIPEPDEFARIYVEASQDLKQRFDLDYATPFFSSTYLKDHLNPAEAADFVRQLVSRVQDHIEPVHCSYIAPFAPDMSSIEVGGMGCVKQRIPATRFIEEPGLSFSYLTALSYIWTHDFANYQQAETVISEAFRDYNQTRLHSALKYVPPAEFLASWVARHK